MATDWARQPQTLRQPLDRKVRGLLILDSNTASNTASDTLDRDLKPLRIKGDTPIKFIFRIDLTSP